MTDQTFEHQLIILKKAEVQSTHTEKDYGTMSPPYLIMSQESNRNCYFLKKYPSKRNFLQVKI